MFLLYYNNFEIQSEAEMKFITSVLFFNFRTSGDNKTVNDRIFNTTGTFTVLWGKSYYIC